MPRHTTVLCVRRSGIGESCTITVHDLGPLLFAALGLVKRNDPLKSSDCSNIRSAPAWKRKLVWPDLIIGPVKRCSSHYAQWLNKTAASKTEQVLLRTW